MLEGALEVEFRDEIIRAASGTEAYVRGEGYRGYDPYDALTSPVFRWPVLRSWKLARWGTQQVVKRLPLQVRPLLGIRKRINPVTLGLAVQALTNLDKAVGADMRRQEVESLVERLAGLRSQGWAGSCWGYDFDWEARYARIPAWHPTVVATGFVTNSLFEAHRHYGIETAGALVLDAVEFVRKDLNRTRKSPGFCWSYSPTDHQEVLNATMKGARLVAQAVSLGGDPAWLDEAAETIDYVASRQRVDGAWPYSVSDPRSWVDHFHTCYILDCLDEFMSLSGRRDWQGTLDRGVAYYLDNFFTPAGAPKYYDRSLYPIDATCCGQAILTLVRFGRLDMAEKTAAWILEHMAMPNGSYKFQIHRRYENRLEYMRWSICWIFAGLSRLAVDLEKESPL